MKFFNRIGGSALKASMLAALFCSGAALAQDYKSMGITGVVGSADRMLQRGDYRGAIPALEEVISRTGGLTDPTGKDTAQTCRFQLARAYYQVGDFASGMGVLEDYLENEPRKKERLALRMMAQGFFDTEDWDKIESLADRLLALPDLEKDDRYNANLLLGQARYRLEKWTEAVDPLSYAAEFAKEEQVRGLCQIMIVRALVEAENWSVLFGKLPAIYRTDSKYDINLNLTLMKAGKALYEQDDFLNALLLYRWVLPREELLDFANKRVTRLEKKLQADVKRGIADAEIEERRGQITNIQESMTTLRELPPYEDEVTFRIGQIYATVKRYWEGYVLFDKLYQQDRDGELGEAAMLQSVLILYDVGEIARAEERILLYLTEKPDGIYARTLLSMMMRDNLIKQNFARVVELRTHVEAVPAPQTEDDRSLQADLHFMLSFGYFQSREYKSAGEQFGVILDDYAKSDPAPDSEYYRGMTYLMVGDYKNALNDFKGYQQNNEYGEHVAASLFREAVCEFGLENIAEAEAAFSKFIETFPENGLVSEAYSMRGDIEASKEATNDDPYTLDRALADYRKGIDKATTQMQASYAAFQAAKVYKLEYKWQEIIDLMNYYMDRWEEQADVAEAVFWVGQAQIELGQVDEAVAAYLDSIERFGNDATQQGVDKIMLELIKVASGHLSDEDREGLAVKLKLKQTNIDARATVLLLRLRVAQAMLQGDDIAAALGAELLEQNVDLTITSPASLALMCDAAAKTGNIDEMERLSDYFMTTYEESELLWHAYRAKAEKSKAEGDDWGVLQVIDDAQGMFGADPDMGWAQILKAETEFKMEKYAEAEASYNMVMGVAEWRGPLFAEAMYGMGKCRLAKGDLEAAHSFFQRVYLLYKSYSDGDWAAKGYLAAADVAFKMGEEEKAVNTLKAMLEDVYTNTNPLAEQVRQQLKKLGVE